MLMPKTDTVTVTRDTWNDIQAYIESLERDNQSLREELEEQLEYIAKLEEGGI